MNLPNHTPTPPNNPAGDISVSRMARAVRPQVQALARNLANQFQVIGMRCETQVRPTPRGQSTFLALVGQRGLVCIVDITLVDGMAVGKGQCLALDIRLLDACGDVVVDSLASGALGHGLCEISVCETSAWEALTSDKLDRAATAVYVAALSHFDLLRHVVWCA